MPKSEATEDRLELPDPVEPEVNVDITTKDPDDDDDDPKLAAAAEKIERDGKTGQWTKKKGERAGEKRGKDDWRSEKANLEGRVAAMSENYDKQMREMREELARTRATPAQNGGQADPFAARFAEIDQQLASELKLIEADKTDPANPYKRYNTLRREESRLIAEEVAFKNAQRAGQQQQQRGENPYAMRGQLMAAEHPWLMDPSKAELVKKVRHIREYLINVDGMPDTIDTDRQAISTAVAQFGAAFGLRMPAAPTERTRGMYGGPGPGASAQRGAPRQDTSVGVPRALLAASGLSEAAVAAALRGDN